eukprot:2194909-Prymnesium_polylepis.1
MGSARGALEFKSILDATPADLKKSPTNIYSQIAVSLKGMALREPGLANLAERLANRDSSRRKVKTTYNSAQVGSAPVSSMFSSLRPSSTGAMTNLLNRLRPFDSSGMLALGRSASTLQQDQAAGS